jgi:hypothetical protein
LKVLILSLTFVAHHYHNNYRAGSLIGENRFFSTIPEIRLTRIDSRDPNEQSLRL